MKKLCVLLVTGFAVAMLLTPQAGAVPAFKKKFEAKYSKKSKNEEFEAAVKKAGCNVCHIKGKKKTERNEYGLALSKLLKKKDFTTAKIKEDPKAADKKMEEGFTKVEKMKNKAGKTFGELLKAGKLPGVK